MDALDSGALAAAARLTARAGLPAPGKVERLAGGKNNRVFQVDDALVLKLYHWDARDTRDRLRAEWCFLKYAWDRGVANIPRPLASDPDLHAGLYSLLPGGKLIAGQVTQAHVDAALAFVLAINAAPRAPDTLDSGSEACFSLNEHIATIDRRVARLASIDPAVSAGEAARSLIASHLIPAWTEVRATLLAEAENAGLDPGETVAGVCVSPSDFGFHNALVSGEEIGFLDFEYAGRDDPAKLVCDFFCQPEVPVPVRHHPDFVRRLSAGLGLDAASRARCALLLDAYRVKWACIILNDFLPLGSARRVWAALTAADKEQTAARHDAQLARAAAKLNEIAPI